MGVIDHTHHRARLAVALRELSHYLVDPCPCVEDLSPEDVMTLTLACVVGHRLLEPDDFKRAEVIKVFKS